MRKHVMIVLLAAITPAAGARELHVSGSGDDAHAGSPAQPLRTISAAARLAQPGDVITVHAGVYRERVSPPRGGRSSQERITYQAAPGEKVVIKGSEVVRGWQKVQNDTWKVSLPNNFFGTFNPYRDLIKGDWFSPREREHHTGAVYVNGHWLTEAATLEQVLAPAGKTPLWQAAGGGQCLLNVAWMRPGGAPPSVGRIPAARFARQQGTQTAPASEGGECIGWIEQGDWVQYDRVDFGSRTEHLEIRAASETSGGVIEIRLEEPNGELLGSCRVPNTGGWQSWASYKATIKPVSGVRRICLAFKGPPSSISDASRSLPQDAQLWFARVDTSHTSIWAQFPGIDPNGAEVEINVRQAVFYPEKPGVNYITVRGFTLMHAATPWAPPTAEQIGLIGTHWSKGWIIENNDIRYSTCVGIALGKHGDEFDNTSQNTAEGYVKTIERGLKNGWSRENIGHHLVRNNRISHCEQAGVVGSLGAVFSTITGNDIHDIHVRQLFTGAEMAGIKIHAAIDTQISRNHIYRTCRGIWLDWMAQGTRVTGNLLHDNGPCEDLFVEVNHGPFLVDNNLLLSPVALLDMSQGGAFVHNLFAGRIVAHPDLGRQTPFHKAHSTQVAGLHNIPGGDHRFYNNVFAGYTGLAAYDKAASPMHLSGNVFVEGASPCKHESSPLVLPEFASGLRLARESDGVSLEISLDRQWSGKQPRPLVTTELLARAKIPDLPYEQPDGSPYRIDTDYLGRPRSAVNPFPGPFELASGEGRMLAVWPVRPN
jgi:hypothetical protein